MAKYSINKRTVKELKGITPEKVTDDEKNSIYSR